MKTTITSPELTGIQSNAEVISSGIRHRARLAMRAAGLALTSVALAACDYLSPKNTSPPEPEEYTVAQFVDERDTGKCPEGEFLKFMNIDVVGPDDAGVFTMNQDGAAGPEDPKILFTMDDEGLTGTEVSSVHIITTTISTAAEGCTLTQISAQ